MLEQPSTSSEEGANVSRSNILPDRYDGQGNFRNWLRHFDACGDASGWSDGEKLRKLPAFLRGRAATHFYSLTDPQCADYATLKKNLQASLCPPVERESNYRKFESRCLRPGEDPAVFRWELEELLRLADPELSADQMNALTARQFMRGLPNELQIKLLESDPVPTLEKMVTFTQNMRAIERTTMPRPSQNVASVSSPESREIAKLTALVEQLSTGQRELRAELDRERTQRDTRRHQYNQPTCYSCGRRGHIARDCRCNRGQITCFNCHQRGHLARDCTAPLNSIRTARQ